MSATLLLFTVLCASPVFAQQTHLLVITGVPGDEEHAKQFQKWSDTFVDAAKKKDSVPNENITVLSDRGATKEGVEKAFADLSAKVKPNDSVVVLLIGHGSFNGQTAAFNLPGPDLTVADWGKLLGKLPAQHVAFINTSSSSGAFLPAVAAPGRVVITATKTGGERNETQFPEFFVAAFNDPSADRDRNGHVSLAEAFEYAKSKVTQAFQQKGLLLTEHATMDDGGEGQLAASMFLGIGRSDSTLAADTSDPAMKKLVDEKEAIDRQIAALRLRKSSMPEAQYDAQMEKLLTELALKTKAIRDLQKKDER
ncbi:MAG TPA: hypothetical protein VKD69_25895 [Vicinamibacterales bacterium]|nr:hypothetical protein [Vicinamibacterales bacterium]